MLKVRMIYLGWGWHCAPSWLALAGSARGQGRDCVATVRRVSS